MRIFALYLSFLPAVFASSLLVDPSSRSIRSLAPSGPDAWSSRPAVSEFDFAQPAPDGRFALLVRNDTLYLVRRLDSSLPVWRELKSDPLTPSRAAFSHDSSALALVDPSSNQLLLWSRINSDPKPAGAVSLASISERIVSLAVDPQARFAFLATQAKDSGTLYLLQPGLEPRMIIPLARAGAIHLAANALYIADRGANTVLRLTNWDQLPNVATLASAGNGLADPVGFALSDDRNTLHVASAGTRQVLTLDLRSGAVQSTLDLDFAPTTLERLGPSPLFLLARGADPLLLDSSTSRVFDLHGND